MVIEVFADNYRGFKHFSFAINKATFLTGDNSSGKSSILLLVDYIFQSELNGVPELDEDYTNDKYDFFSPYFRFADVTIGFIRSGSKKRIGKVITIKREAKGNAPRVTRLTWVENNIRATFHKSERSASYKVSEFSGDLTVETLSELHRETRGFKLLQLDEDEAEFGANSPAIVYAAMRAHKGDEIVSRSIFSSTRIGRLPGVRHSGPVRGLPKRFYNLDRKINPSGAHFASMWHDLTEAQASARLEEVRRFGKESALFDDISVEKISTRVNNSPLLVKVTKKGRSFLLGQVGVGVSQVIPIVVESALGAETPKNAINLLQQPELHLHPVAQAALGEFIYSMTKNGLHYIIETHSDYLIDRFRAKTREDDEPPLSQIIFCKNSDDGNTCHTIGINGDGEVVNTPDGYKEFFVEELIRTMF